MPLPEIMAAIASLKSAVEITKYINSTSKNVAINEKAIELQNIILSIQASMLELQPKYYELLESKNDLEKKLVEMEKWEVTESQYDLVQDSGGVFVFMPNKNHPNPQPDHYLCTNCFNNKRKSLLQREDAFDIPNYICPNCNMKVPFRPSKINR